MNNAQPKSVSNLPWCPGCRGSNVNVVDSRPVEDKDFGFIVRRRRTCNNCDHRWTTYEVSAEIYAKFCEAPREPAVIVTGWE